MKVNVGEMLAVAAVRLEKNQTRSICGVIVKIEKDLVGEENALKNYYPILKIFRSFTCRTDYEIYPYLETPFLTKNRVLFLLFLSQMLKNTDVEYKMFDTVAKS